MTPYTHKLFLQQVPGDAMLLHEGGVVLDEHRCWSVSVRMVANFKFGNEILKRNSYMEREYAIWFFDALHISRWYEI